MRKFFIVTGLLGLAGMAAGALVYVFGRETIDELLSQTPADKPDRDDKPTRQSSKQTVSQKKTVEKTGPLTTPADESAIVSVKGSGGKFHKPECRYAGDEDAERITRKEAVERGFTPCGSCKP